MVTVLQRAMLVGVGIGSFGLAVATLIRLRSRQIPTTMIYLSSSNGDSSPPAELQEA